MILMLCLALLPCNRVSQCRSLEIEFLIDVQHASASSVSSQPVSNLKWSASP